MQVGILSPFLSEKLSSKTVYLTSKRLSFPAGFLPHLEFNVIQPELLPSSARAGWAHTLDLGSMSSSVGHSDRFRQG